MSIGVESTDANHLLAQGLAGRMGADASLTESRAAFFRFVGLGTVAASLGIAAGLGLYAWSRIHNTQATQGMIAAAMHQAFEKVVLKADTTGEVVAGGAVGLKPGQTVALASGGTVALEPGATVKVTGAIRLEQPPPAPAPPQEAGRSAASLRPAVTNYTVFKTVDFARGHIQTGWVFSSSNDRAPSRQYCIYVEDLGETGTQAQVNLGNDGQMTPQSRPRVAIDTVAAYSNCVWFKGSL